MHRPIMKSRSCICPSTRLWIARVAINAVNTAVRLNRDNVAYRVAKADILWAQGSWHNAVNEYKKVLKFDPRNTKAAYMIGHHGIKNFMKYYDMFMMSMDVGNQTGEKAFTRARHSFRGFLASRNWMKPSGT